MREGLTEAGTESDGVDATSRVGCCRVGAIRVVEGLDSCSPREPKGAEAGEDDEGESVTDYPLTNASQNHQKTTKEEVRSDSSSTISASTVPANKIAA